MGGRSGRPAGPASRVRLFVRAAWIACLVALHGLRWWAGWLFLLVTFAGKPRRQTWFGQNVLALFRGLGATFIKVGQIMSTRPDLLPHHVTLALERLQDDVGPFPFDDVCRILEEDLGRPPSELFAELAPVPLASASVAQVHKARLPDGRIAAVKVRRPQLTEICTFDLAVMRFWARILGKWPSFDTLDPAATVAEFGRAVFQQLDFRIEAENNLRFRHNFRNQDEIIFPQIFPELCSERVLTMSFIEGTKILSVTRTRSDPKAIARMGMRALMKMIFEDGFVHADLHPGNFFVTAQGKLALVDLGLVGELDDPHRKAFARFFAAWARRDGDTMARLMYGLSSNPTQLDSETYERYRAAIIEFVGRYWGQRLGDVSMGRVLVDLLGILRQHRVRMTPTFTTVNIAIAMTEGIGRQLDPELDLMAEALPFFMAHPVDAA
jgi:ubiquinone biosynthesis protein